MKKWLWLGYPAAVLVIVVVSSKFLLFDQSKWTSLLTDQQKVAEQQAQIAELKRKLGILSNVDIAQETDRLKVLVNAQPPNKAVWSLVSEMKSAATGSGVIINGYKGGAGGVREASGSAEATAGSDESLILKVQAQIDDMTKMGKFLTSLYIKLPLARINTLTWTDGQVDMEIESAWQPWQAVAKSDSPLPDYRAEVAAVSDKLSGFESLVQATAATDSSIVTNPF